MKKFLAFLFVLLSQFHFSQVSFPDFLQGSWKTENDELYEHWDKLDNNTLKGFSYKTKNGEILVSEYLEITQKQNKIVYSASVINQNQGTPVEFTLTRSDSVFTFENPSHDFPKKIIYRKLSGDEVLVQVSDGKQKGFSYKMKKQNSIQVK